MYLNYNDFLYAFRKRGHISIGIDPNPHYISSINLEKWIHTLIDDTFEYSLAYKFNYNFFEAYGIKGIDLLYKLTANLSPSHFIIIDAKKSDISKSFKIGIEYILYSIGADAVTIIPFFSGTISPQLYPRKYLILVIYPTEPVPYATFYNYIIERIAAFPPPPSSTMLATSASDFNNYMKIRTLLSKHILLVPGIYSQYSPPMSIITEEIKNSSQIKTIFNIGSYIYNLDSPSRKKFIKGLYQKIQDTCYSK